MESLALRPRKATEIVDAAVEVYRRDPIQFLLLAAIVRVPWLLVQILLVGGRDTDGAAIVTSMIVAVGTLVTTLLMTGFVVHMASELYLGRKTDALETIRRTWPKMAAVFIASVVQGIGIMLGLALFLFPAMWVASVVFAVIPVIMIENGRVGAAFGRSSRLSDGMKGHILSTLGLVFLIRVIVEIGIGALSLLIPMAELRFVAVSAAAMLIYPLIGIAETLLYYDIRIRKEGFDIEMMAQAASEPAPASV